MGIYLINLSFVKVFKQRGNGIVQNNGTQLVGTDLTAATDVRGMFRDISKRYDRANTVLSGGIHHLWKRQTVSALKPQSGETALDLCCGTGDLALLLAARLGPGGRVFALDFVPEMLRIATRKATRQSRMAKVHFIHGDATRLPIQDRSCDLVTIGFGIRNIPEADRALAEAKRVLRPGGRIGVLEFGTPAASLGGRAYSLYANHLLPCVGGFISGNRAAYNYLTKTACGYPTGESFLTWLRNAGFENGSWRPLLFGIAHIYTASTPGHYVQRV